MLYVGAKDFQQSVVLQRMVVDLQVPVDVRVVPTVRDDDGGTSNQSVYEFVVVYDPDHGFVTGGGWINSPAGAYSANPTITGKATFGFVALNEKGATVPRGNTEFQLHVAGLNFKSTSYDWLVIAGSRAQLKGSGSLNGAGSYAFMLTAVDGQIAGMEPSELSGWIYSMSVLDTVIPAVELEPNAPIAPLAEMVKLPEESPL